MKLRLILAGLILALAAPATADSPYNVLLVTVDSLRADHCGPYGYHRATTPALDTLALRGTTFEQVITPLPRTTQSLASLLTSLDPISHGVLRMEDRLDDGYTSLADVFAVFGYATAAFLEHPMRILEPDPRGGNLGQGFEEQYRGRGQIQRAMEWLERVEEPFFLWVHIYDPHWSYDPPPETRRFVDPGYPQQRYEELVAGSTKGAVVFQNEWASADVAHATDLYDGEVLAADRKLEQLLRTLGPTRLGRTFVSVLGDHGEALGDHHYHFDHGERLHEELIRIPWVLAGPTTARFPRRFRGALTIMEVAPTLLEVAGLPIPPGFEGIGLGRKLARGRLSGLLGKKNLRRHIFGISDVTRFPENPNQYMRQDRGRHRFIRSEPWKLIVIPREEKADTVILYNLKEDPKELRNQAYYQPDRAAQLHLLLRGYLHRWSRALPGAPQDPADVREDALRALGYVD